MTLLRYIFLLQFTTTLTLGQNAHQRQSATALPQPKTVIRSLYRAVIARHPIGIPTGSDMKVLAPYLSKELLRKMKVADACSADWSRQNPDPNLKPDIGWLEVGLFSGGVEKASPR